jgi:hypothetical protein
MCDVDTILGLPCVLFMQEFVNALMKFVQAKDIFICDYIVAIKINQVNLYKIYNSPSTSFQLENFLSLQMWL